MTEECQQISLALFAKLGPLRQWQGGEPVVS